MPPGSVRPEDILQVARVAEELGYDSVWGNDHFTPSNRIRSRFTQMPNFYEILIALTYCAAVTKRIQLGLAIIVMPLRDPFLLAKQLATMDVFSGGRVIFGVGLGSQRDEFERLYPKQGRVHRGAMMDEALEAMNLLFKESVASFSGKYYEFKEAILEPKPLQKPFPIYISGHSPATIERTVKAGTGLMIFSATVEYLRESVERLHALADKRGRDASEIDVLISTTLSMAPTREKAIQQFQGSSRGQRDGASSDITTLLRSNLIGTQEEIIERIGHLQAAGLKNCAITAVVGDTSEERIEQMQMFAEEVMPAFR